MGKALERLEKLKEEKEKLIKLHAKIKRKKSVFDIFKRKDKPHKEQIKKFQSEQKKPIEPQPEKRDPIKSDHAVHNTDKLDNKVQAKKSPALKLPRLFKKQVHEKNELKKPSKKIKRVQKKKKRSKHEQKKRFENFIKKSGLEVGFDEINKKILFASIGITAIVSSYFLLEIFIKKSFLSDAILLLSSIWIVGPVVIYFLLWILFFFVVDIKIFQRRKEIESVFPDFLQLTAANINAGMPIDRALWFAIRPRFGILAEEMEIVAKSTMVGENLSKALIDFTNRYDSMTLKRSINLLLEGLESGGEIGELLSRIATNIRETEIIKKEMASNVTTYVIFILFATLVAAPFLFGLTTQLIVIMSSILSNIQIGDNSASFGGIGGMMAMSGDAISLRDYQIFAIVSICISSTFAAIIINVIQKGNAKEAYKQIPTYIGIGVVIYVIAFKILNAFLGGFFS